jgi:hypothetical protein
MHRYDVHDYSVLERLACNPRKVHGGVVVQCRLPDHKISDLQDTGKVHFTSRKGDRTENLLGQWL